MLLAAIFNSHILGFLKFDPFIYLHVAVGHVRSAGQIGLIGLMFITCWNS